MAFPVPESYEGLVSSRARYTRIDEGGGNGGEVDQSMWLFCSFLRIH